MNVKIGQKWRYKIDLQTYKQDAIFKIIAPPDKMYNCVCEKVFISEPLVYEVGQEYFTGYDKWVSNSWSLYEEIEYKEIDVCECKKCQTINEFAEPNQEDGSYVCYNCR